MDKHRKNKPNNFFGLGKNRKKLTSKNYRKNKGGPSKADQNKVKG